MKHKIIRCIRYASPVGLLLSFVWILGVAGGADAETIPSISQYVTYTVIGLVVMGLCVLGIAYTDGEG